MKRISRITALLLILTFFSSSSFQKVDYREGMYKNVCKNLKNDVLLYFIFVDTKTTSPWTEFDIRSTIDSVAVARNWLMQMARQYHVNLNIKTDYFIGKDFTTITRNLPQESIKKSATTPNVKKGLASLNEWADQIAKKIGSTLDLTPKDGLPDIKSPRNKERLIAYLRDEYNVESVALLFMVNNYFRSDISIPINIMNTDDVEFAIVSYKYPAEIAHNFLNLYGAADMFPSLYRRNIKKAKALEALFPNEIMLDPYARSISTCEISDYTRFLIGWQDTVDPSLDEYFEDKNKNF